MTLNITALTSDVIYQSADFRLTYGMTGIFKDESNKTVNLDYPALKGMVTYTGIGKIKDVDIATYVGEWISGPNSLGLAEIADIIRSQSNALFVETGAVGEPHTFVLAAFEESQPSVFVISNFQNAYGNSTVTPGFTFEVSWRRLERGEPPIVLVTGWTLGVSRELQANLNETISAHPNDGGRIRRLLLTANAKISEDVLSDSKISRDCIVRSIERDGTVRSETSGSGAPFAPDIHSGVDLSVMTREVLRSIGFNPDEMKAVQSTSAQFRPNRPVVNSTGGCDQPTIPGNDESEYQLETVHSADFSVLGATAVNESGWFVGRGRKGWDRSTPEWLPWLYRDGLFKNLNFTGYPKMIGDDGRVVGIDYSELPSQHVIRWTEDQLERIDGWTSPDGVVFESSLPNSQNMNGEVAGNMSIIVAGKGTTRSVACVFSPNGDVLPFPGPELNVNDRAMSINQDGTVLISQYQIPWIHLVSLWNIHDGSIVKVGDDATRAIVPIALRSDGTVFGQARDGENRLLAVMTDESKNWVRLGTPPDYAISAINNRGDIVGTTKIDGLQRPWIRRAASGDLSLLPYLSEHHCHPTAINDGGIIVGSAGSDSCDHALRWLK